MTVDWQHFTPWSSLAGGILIGAAAALLVLANGRVAGISGILSGFVAGRRPDLGWRAAFIIGLLVAPAAVMLFSHLPVPRIEAGPALLVLAGVLVGLGTCVGSGCTSGHGVCGLARLSPRSLVATLTFMATGIVTVFVLRHVF